MKNRICGMLLTCFMLVCALPVQVLAAQSEVIHYDDGSYAVITVEKAVGTARATNYTSGSKEYKYYSSSNVIQWKATLNATFTYTGSSATCTKVNSLNVTIYDSAWSVGSKSTSKSGNTAYGYLTMNGAIIGGTQGVPVTLTLSCDKNGNLS